VAGYLFGIGSVLTPLFLGATLGGLLTARVPEGNAAGDELTSWFNPTSLATGLLVLLTGAFLSAVYLVAESRRRGAPDLLGYFRVRALVAGGCGLVAGAATLGALLADQRTMFDRVIGRSWPLLILGVLTLAATFWLAARGVIRGLRLVAAAGVAALVAAWGVAQYPYVLPFSLTISDAAGAPLTLKWVLGCSVVALFTVGPALILLFVLDQRDAVGEDPTTSPEPTLSSWR
jgi:cytochrome d ubiquinol oxidase subunit II